MDAGAKGKVEEGEVEMPIPDERCVPPQRRTAPARAAAATATCHRRVHC